MFGKRRNVKSRLIVILGALILTPIIWFLVLRFEGQKPLVTLDMPPAALGVSQEIGLTVSEAKSGIRKIWMGLTRDGQEFVLLEKSHPASGLISGGEVHQSSFKVAVEPKKLGISEGQVTLKVMVRDFSWRGWFKGNLTTVEKQLIVDTRPPQVTVVTRAHYVNQGGAGVAVYRVSESCPVSGVQVGDQFFPGDSGYYDDESLLVAFFALDYRQGPKTQMFVRASDVAGNQTRAGFYHRLRKKRFKADKIKITDGFLDAKLPEFESLIPEASKESKIAKFLWINNDLRRDSYTLVKEITQRSDARMHWKGPFSRLPNSKRMAGFADSRDYIYKGKIVDHQDHLGIDLAAYSHDVVPSANRGRVVFQDYLGIYGNTVILDHGLGLFSIYGHLSRIDVEKDQMVEKGAPLGLTGKSGLAGGDHLHFGILIRSTYVNPIEWWGEAWVKDNVTDKLEKAAIQ